MRRLKWQRMDISNHFNPLDLPPSRAAGAAGGFHGGPGGRATVDRITWEMWHSSTVPPRIQGDVPSVTCDHVWTGSKVTRPPGATMHCGHVDMYMPHSSRPVPRGAGRRPPPRTWRDARRSGAFPTFFPGQTRRHDPLAAHGNRPVVPAGPPPPSGAADAARRRRLGCFQTFFPGQKRRHDPLATRERAGSCPRDLRCRLGWGAWRRGHAGEGRRRPVDLCETHGLRVLWGGLAPSLSWESRGINKKKDARRAEGGFRDDPSVSGPGLSHRGRCVPHPGRLDRSSSGRSNAARDVPHPVHRRSTPPLGRPPSRGAGVAGAAGASSAVAPGGRATADGRSLESWPSSRAAAPHPGRRAQRRM